MIEILDLPTRLRSRMRHGLFATMRTMEEAANEIEALQRVNDSLQGCLDAQTKRYDFAVQQWMAERFIADQLYADLTDALSPLGTLPDECKTVFMKKYEESRRHGVMQSVVTPE